MAPVNKQRAWFIIRGMTEYVNRMYKSEKFGADASEITMEEDLYLPSQLKTMLYQAMILFKTEKFVIAHNHYVDMEDREKHMKRSFQRGLVELGREHTHVEFLRECVLYIMSATEMEHLCFPEAKDIVMKAIYQACMNTEQHKDLVLWKTQPVGKLDSASNGPITINLENHEDQPTNTTQQDVCSRPNGDASFSSEVDILG